jgi:N-acetylneuraminate synthase
MERTSNIKPVIIGRQSVGPGCRTFVVGEIGINHNGDIKLAKELVDMAAQVGCDAVKLQTRTIRIVYTAKELAQPREVPREILENAIRREVLSSEAVARLKQSNFEASTNGDLKAALEFTDGELQEFDRHCQNRNMMWFTACWDIESVERVERLFPHLPCHKIASPCNEDDALLKAVRQTGKPVILSTGMTDLDGVHAAINVLGRDNLIILHCTSVYPRGTDFGDEILQAINLRGIDTLTREFGVPVGFSSHDAGIMPSYAAAARGAVMLEKHITMERSMFGSDQAASLEPQELLALCRAVQEVYLILGDGKIVVYPSEEVAITKLRRVRRSK